ncbi:MAG: hypothetical protein HY859_03860 [Caulobacterales bacterium]|nr:hypothetical protein [Caulobacterales bacterium]
MRTLLGAMLSVVLLASAGIARAAEANCADPAGGPSYANTRWTGASEWDGLSPNPMTLFLRGDCVVEYTSKGETFANGTWVQRGNLIEWQANDHFAVYIGQAGLGQIGGVMYNRNGLRGTWRFKRSD